MVHRYGTRGAIVYCSSLCPHRLWNAFGCPCSDLDSPDPSLTVPAPKGAARGPPRLASAPPPYACCSPPRGSLSPLPPHGEPPTGGRLQPVLMRYPLQLSVKTWGLGGGVGWGGAVGGGGGGRLEGRGGGGGSAGGSRGGGSAGGSGGGSAVGGGGGLPRWGGLRATHNNHMRTSRGAVCLGRVWGKLLAAVVKQGLQIGRCVHRGCGDLHFTTNDICLAPRLANLALKTWMV